MAEFIGLSVQLRPGLFRHRLTFALSGMAGSLRGNPSAALVDDLALEMEMFRSRTGGRILLGKAELSRSTFPILFSGDPSRKLGWQFEMYLSTGDLLALEEWSSGERVTLELRAVGMGRVCLVPHTSGNPGPFETPSSIEHEYWSPARVWGEVATFNVPREELTDAFRACGFADFVAAEVRVPRSNATPEIAEAVQIWKNARQALLEGRYFDSVAQCRMAIEKIAGSGSIPALPSRDQQQDPRSLDKSQRIRMLLESIYRVCHLAHHPTPEVSPSENFDRAEATALVMSTLALFGHYVRG